MESLKFLLILVFCISCSNTGDVEMPSTASMKMNSKNCVSKLEVVKVLKDPVYIDYNIQHRQLFEKIYKTFNAISEKDRQDLLAMFPLYTNDSEQYLYLAQEKIKETIGENVYNDLLSEMEILQLRGEKLLKSENYLNLDDMDKNLIINDLFYNLPSISICFKPTLQTKSVSESECIQDCAASRDEAIQEAAYAALCGMAAGLAACVVSGGWGSVGGLVSAFLAAHAGDMAITNAWKAYERCIKYC